jgi:hypothetical protein
MKRCYYSLTDIYGDLSELILDEKGLADYLEGERGQYTDSVDEREYKIEIVYMTPEEFENLPEYEF